MLYLTNRRVLFEQKERTGAFLGIFGGRDQQALRWAERLDNAPPLTRREKCGQTLEDRACSGEPNKVRRALWCDLPPDRTRVLLLVDQFKELVTIARSAERESCVQLLLALADPNDPAAARRT